MTALVLPHRVHAQKIFISGIYLDRKLHFGPDLDSGDYDNYDQNATSRTPQLRGTPAPPKPVMLPPAVQRLRAGSTQPARMMVRIPSAAGIFEMYECSP